MCSKEEEVLLEKRLFIYAHEVSRYQEWKMPFPTVDVVVNLLSRQINLKAIRSVLPSDFKD